MAAELKLKLPRPLCEDIGLLLDARRVSYTHHKGLGLDLIVVQGPQELLDALKPRIEALESDYVSRAAW